MQPTEILLTVVRPTGPTYEHITSVRTQDILEDSTAIAHVRMELNKKM